jgi:hypothetical protein
MNTFTRFSLLVLFAALSAQFTRANAPSGALDLPFVPNAGQFDSRVAFRAATFAGTAYVSRDGQLVYALPPRSDQAGLPAWSLVEHFQGRRATPVGLTAASPRVAFITGLNGEANSRRRDLPTWRAVSLGEIWPGVQVSLRAENRNVEKIFEVAPGASPTAIRVAVRGALALNLGAGGSLVASTGLGPVQFAAPIAYQMQDGKRQKVRVGYRLENGGYGFTLGRYDRSRALVIDPIIQTTYLGTAAPSALNRDETVNDIKVHATSGDIYIAGTAHNTGFPGTTGGAQPSFGGFSSDGYVARLAADLRSVIQATYLGGSAGDGANGLHLTATDVYVVGSTDSSNFPATAGSAQPTNPTPVGAAYIARLPLNLQTITAATYLRGVSGTNNTELFAVGVHPNGDVYACGNSFNNTLPATTGAAVTGIFGSGSSAIVARATPDLATFVRVTYHTAGSFCASMAFLPSSGEIVVVGRLASGASLPNTAGSAFPSIGGTARGWASKFSADLSTMPISSYVVGGGNAATVRVHPSNGDVYVMATGSDPTGSAFPPNSFATAAQPACGGAFDCAAVLRFSTGLNTMVGGTFYGNGSQTTGGSSIMRAHNHMVIDPVTGDVFIGLDSSRGMPNTAGSFMPSLGSGNSTPSIVARLSGDLTQIRRASYVANATNSGGTRVHAVMIHPLNGDFYIAGRTGSVDLPGISGGAQAVHAGSEDGFIMRVTADLGAGIATPGVLQFSAATFSRAENGNLANITVTRTSGTTGTVTVQFSTSPGSAQAGSDYTAVTGTLTWTDGDANPKSFDVPLIDDTAVEGAETVNLTLANTTGGATLGSQNTAVLTITDNDTAPTNPGIAVSGTSASFANTLVGSTSASQTVTVTSNGTANLVLGAVTRGGTHSGDFAVTSDNCSNQTLAPNATCAVQLTFTPGAAGARSATLSIASNAAGSPTVVNLSGTGDAPPPPPPPPPPVSGDRVPGGGGAIDHWLLGALGLLVTVGTLRRGAIQRRRWTEWRSVFVAAVALGSAVSKAEWQLGIDVLQSDWSNAAGIGSLSVPSSTRTVTKDSDTGFGMNIGYRFGPNMILEAGYRDLGAAGVRDVLATGNPATLDLKLDTRLSHVAAVGEWSWAQNWFAQVRIGVVQSRTKLSASNGRREVLDSDDLLLGAAIGRTFVGGWRLRLQLDRVETGSFNPAPGFTQNLQAGRVNVISVGMQKTF